jgi:hypothetical protein
MLTSLANIVNRYRNALVQQLVSAISAPLDSQLVNPLLATWSRTSQCMSFVVTAASTSTADQQQLAFFATTSRELFAARSVEFTQLTLTVDAFTTPAPPPTVLPVAATTVVAQVVPVSATTSSNSTGGGSLILIVIVIVAVVFILIGMTSMYISRNRSKEMAILQADIMADKARPTPLVYNPHFSPHTLKPMQAAQTPDSTIYAPYGQGTLHNRRAIQNDQNAFFPQSPMAHQHPGANTGISPLMLQPPSPVQPFQGYSAASPATLLRFPREEDELPLEPPASTSADFQRLIPMPHSTVPAATPTSAPKNIPTRPDNAALITRDQTSRLAGPPQAQAQAQQPRAPPEPPVAAHQQAESHPATPVPVAAAQARPQTTKAAKKKGKRSGSPAWQLALSRPEAEAHLRALDYRGAFVVRPSKNASSGFVLSVLDTDQIRHHPIHIDETFGKKLFTLSHPLKFEENGESSIVVLLRRYMTEFLTPDGLTLAKTDV